MSKYKHILKLIVFKKKITYNILNSNYKKHKTEDNISNYKNSIINKFQFVKSESYNYKKIKYFNNDPVQDTF